MPETNTTEGYREHTPHPVLRRHVECYWTIHVPGEWTAPAVDRVLPDGCTDILFGLDERSRAGGRDPHVVGTMTRPLEVMRTGGLALLGVRFRPGGARPYLDVDASELTDASTGLDTLWGDTDAHRVRDRMSWAADDAARIRVLDLTLMDRLERSGAADEAVLRAAAVVAARPNACVDDLADAAGLGRRQLERRFIASVGLTPKMACRVLRFRAAAARLHADPTQPLSRLAYASGYADQAHLTREFRSLAGTTPGRYRAAALVGA